MFFNTLKSEWTKLRSTASFWWTTGLVFLLSVGFAALLAQASSIDATAAPGIDPYLATMGYSLAGLAVVLIQAIMVVTTEYRYGLVQQNYLATPKRWPVIAAKFVLYAVVAAIISLLVVVASYLVVDVLLPEDAAAQFTPFKDETGQRLLWAVPLVTVVAVLFVQGIGLLVRQTAGAVAITIIWMLGFDQFLRFIPRIGDDMAKIMPFQNLNNFLSNLPFEGTDWSPWSSLGVAAIWAVVAWVAGLVLALRRDA